MPELTLLKKAQSDPALKEAGVWHDILVPGVDGGEPVTLRLKMRSLVSNKARTWDLARFRKNRRYYLNDGVPPVEVLDQDDIDKLAEALIVAWDLIDHGVDVPCTVQMVRSVMVELPDLRRDALAACGRHERYRLDEVAAIAGNSERPSSPISSTGAAAV